MEMINEEQAKAEILICYLNLGDIYNSNSFYLCITGAKQNPIATAAAAAAATATTIAMMTTVK